MIDGEAQLVDGSSALTDAGAVAPQAGEANQTLYESWLTAWRASLGGAHHVGLKGRLTQVRGFRQPAALIASLEALSANR